jgi:hypothetical protein
VTQYKLPNSDASGAAKIEVPAKPPSPTASSNEPSANRPTIPPTHRQPRRSEQLHPRTATTYCGPTPSQKSMLTQDSPSANPPLPRNGTIKHHQLLPHDSPNSGSTASACPHHGWRSTYWTTMDVTRPLPHGHQTIAPPHPARAATARSSPLPSPRTILAPIPSTPPTSSPHHL